jgi:hypothetical protein
MNNIHLIEKLKAKANESNEQVETTLKKQKDFLKSAKDFNLKLRNYIEGDIHEKNSFSDAQEKISHVKTRIENSKHIINVLKDKIRIIKTKYEIK